MAPCARGPGWADCGGADGGGRLQRPELVLCDFSARCTRERGGSAPNTTISTDHWTAGKAQKMSNGADSAAKHKLPPASESTPQFEIMECDLRALTTMDLQLCHRISVTSMTKPDPCLWSTCPSIFFIVGDVAFLFQWWKGWLKFFCHLTFGTLCAKTRSWIKKSFFCLWKGNLLCSRLLRFCA